jgi:hypothetical protein
LLRRLRWVEGLVDPYLLGELGRGGWLADEPLGVGGEGALQHLGAGGDDLLGAAIVDVGWVSSAIPLWRWSALYQPKNPWQNPRASWMQPNRSGKAGW